ncbi:SGNH/GDSL hydrolase family protein [Arthrobacter sp. zg-Y1143]|uniref:SGNH/GDSL hydrolase family protein n=1 Tax=Arthrobacter sp. zg-Y1143 TaxID=3049065 RepID=UPI0024C3C4ED|nr:SGNH/GDSL hydrolase family protein [Arthrobacter sp. zg-Y1143]MDK1328303.1 SGNH/GDSL hydrolase family protein [Arthrobacter sp. zg-Y1143]
MPSGWLAGRSGDAGRLVLLGDSFAAGEGAGDYRPAVPGYRDSCHRSLHPVGTDLFAPENITNIACSRATTGHLEALQQLVTGDSGRDAESVPAQLEQLQAADPTLVLLSVGGNDLDFAGLLQACLLEAQSCSENPQLREDAAEQLAGLQPALAEAYSRTAAAVTVPVLVLPYPQLFDAPQDGCGRLDPGEQAFARQLITDLNATIRSAVVASPAANIFYVDAVEGALTGHGACSRDPYVHTANVSGLLEAAGSRAADQELLHPTRDGYRAMTRELIRWADQNPAPGTQ